MPKHAASPAPTGFCPYTEKEGTGLKIGSGAADIHTKSEVKAHRKRAREVYRKCPAPLFCGQTARGPKVKYSAKRHASTSYRERGHPCPGAACLDF